MFFGGRATGRPNFRPWSGLRALAGAFLARSPRGLRSPLLWASTSARFDGTFASTACRSITLSPSTTPRRNPSLVSNPTIFMTLEAPSCAEGRDYKKRAIPRLYASGLIGVDFRSLTGSGIYRNRVATGPERAHIHSMDMEA